MKVPKPAVARLSMLYRFLEELEKQGIQSISSSKIAAQLGLGSHNIRKDIGYLGEIGNTGSGYDVKRLKDHISSHLGFDHERHACVVGLGRLGSAIMNFDNFIVNGYRIVAGFDSNINVLETIKTDIDVYPSHAIEDIVKQKNIELAVLTVPVASAQEVTDKLLQGGIQGIVNFTPGYLKVYDYPVYVSNIDVVGAFDELIALSTLNR